MKPKESKVKQLLKVFLDEYLPIVKGLSERTITSYRTTYMLLYDFLFSEKHIPSDKVSFETLSTQNLTDFLNWLESSRGCSISTRNQRLSALSSFAAFAQNHDFDAAAVFANSISKIPNKKAPRQGRSTFTREELKILFDLPSKRSEIGLRDRVLLSTMYATGMRAQEVCNLLVGDIRFYPDRAGINVRGKGKKIRRIGIPKDAAKILQDYINHRKIANKTDRHVFSSQTHEQMTVSCIEEIYEKYVEMARAAHPDMFREHYTPHSMRHTTATHMIQSNVPLIVVRNFLGHVSLQTTMIYIELTNDAMDQQLKSWNDKWFMKPEATTKKKEAQTELQQNRPDFLR